MPSSPIFHAGSIGGSLFGSTAVLADGLADPERKSMVGKRTVRDRMIVRGGVIGHGSKVTRMEHKFRGHVVWKLIEVHRRIQWVEVFCSG
jgi:hypothetical protein